MLGVFPPPSQEHPRNPHKAIKPFISILSLPLPLLLLLLVSSLLTIFDNAAIDPKTASGPNISTAMTLHRVPTVHPVAIIAVLPTTILQDPLPQPLRTQLSTSPNVSTSMVGVNRKRAMIPLRTRLKIFSADQGLVRLLTGWLVS